MNRNEFLDALPISRITLKVIGAMLEICTDDIDDIHVMVSGTDREVSGLKVNVHADQLLIEQPATALARNPVSPSWMQLTVRLPRSWKGRIDARTVTGWVNARSLRGADLTLESISGMITASDMDFITLSLRSVTGDLHLTDAACQSCALSTTSGEVKAGAVTLRTCSLNSITGCVSLMLPEPFEEITATTVSGDVFIQAPVPACDAALRSVAGHIRTGGIAITQGAPRIRMTSVSGGLDVSCPEAEALPGTDDDPEADESGYPQDFPYNNDSDFKEVFSHGSTEFWFWRRRKHAAAHASGAEDAADDDRGAGEAGRGGV